MAKNKLSRKELKALLKAETKKHELKMAAQKAAKKKQAMVSTTKEAKTPAIKKKRPREPSPSSASDEGDSSSEDESHDTFSADTEEDEKKKTPDDAATAEGSAVESSAAGEEDEDIPSADEEPTPPPPPAKKKKTHSSSAAAEAQPADDKTDGPEPSSSTGPELVALEKDQNVEWLVPKGKASSSPPIINSDGTYSFVQNKAIVLETGSRLKLRKTNVYYRSNQALFLTSEENNRSIFFTPAFFLPAHEPAPLSFEIYNYGPTTVRWKKTDSLVKLVPLSAISPTAAISAFKRPKNTGPLYLEQVKVSGGPILDPTIKK